MENSAANPLEGTWIERGQLKTNWESFALDATTFAHRGRRYLAWAQKDLPVRLMAAARQVNQMIERTGRSVLRTVRLRRAAIWI